MTSRRSPFVLPIAADLGSIRLAVAVIAASGGPASGAGTGADRDPEPVTFARDIAPIIQTSCAPCHRPGESAPFSLLGYADVRKRDRQIVMVTESRFMPPWLPEAGDVPFVGERRLTDEQIALIRRWVEAGSVEGDRADLPPAPTWTEGWQLGEPELVVTLDRPFTVPPDGTDVFRNFVFPVPTEEPRWVRAVELRVGNPRVVHHAVIQIDRTRSSRRDDAKDPAPGFAGMSMGRSVPPDGQFLGWTPGKLPYAGAEGISWRLERGTDLVVQLHMVPTGKPETVQPSIGLFFAEEPPTRHPVVILLRDDAIDIPPGMTDYAIEDSFVLPVPVEVTGVYPHAHYLGREIQGFAVLPDGSRRSLIHIRDWDFNWQDEYRFAEPIDLPAGTMLGMRFTYDNSAANVRNPSHPPKHVRFGERSVDEMGTLTIQVVPRSLADRETLSAAYRSKRQGRFLAYANWKLDRHPRDSDTLQRLGSVHLTKGDVDRAAECFEKAIDCDPDNVYALTSLGGVRGMQGRYHEAVGHFIRALEQDPDQADAHNNIGVAYLNIGKPDAAIGHFHDAVRLDPELVGASINLGKTLVGRGRASEAVRQYRSALLRAPDPRLHHHLANAYLAMRRPNEAVEHYREALRMDPDYLAARWNLGSALTAQGEYDEAIRVYAEALEAEPGNASVRARLGNLLLRRGRVDEAIRELRRALESRPDIAEAHHSLAGALLTQGHLDAARPHFFEAARLDPNRAAHLNSAAWLLATASETTPENTQRAVEMAERAAELTSYRSASVLDTLAASYAAAGDFDRAIRTVRSAIGLANTARDEAMLEKLRSRLALYERGEPVREGR